MNKKLQRTRVYISNIRGIIRDLKAITPSIPPFNYTPEVKISGRTLIVDGKKYSPKDLQSMKRTQSNFTQFAIMEATKQLEELEYERIRITGKHDKTTALEEDEVEFAIRNVDRLTEEDVDDFDVWLNSGSSGYRKKLFYHDYGATSINRGSVRGFLIFMGADTIDELDGVVEQGDVQ